MLVCDPVNARRRGLQSCELVASRALLPSRFLESLSWLSVVSQQQSLNTEADRSLGKLEWYDLEAGLCVSGKRTQAGSKFAARQSKVANGETTVPTARPSQIEGAYGSKSIGCPPLCVCLCSLLLGSRTIWCNRHSCRCARSPCATTYPIATLRTRTWSLLPRQTPTSPRPLSLVVLAAL